MTDFGSLTVQLTKAELNKNALYFVRNVKEL